MLLQKCFSCVASYSQLLHGDSYNIMSTEDIAVHHNENRVCLPVSLSEMIAIYIYMIVLAPVYIFSIEHTQ